MKYKYKYIEVESDSENNARSEFKKLYPEYWNCEVELIDICGKCENHMSWSHNHRGEESCRKKHYDDIECGYRHNVNSCKDLN